ncbi:hypothetical protein C8C83_3038 [Flavobacterium sp. 90]|uniref:hypothetical protein n=1 Tax=unclassified Flavobacterium TaxID=196869 RepID=UPI000EB3C4AF|nr:MULTISPECIES: hypothetical protein [unclassified Flavobacterium]RKR11318.1 hypothetical protein C8C82_3348 [Flavobacterium sp. 81]TCK55099.1 hypothetical protein C8C83_3038 [Flavobacterium sp. 90]
MRKIILSLLIVSILLIGGYLFYDFKVNRVKIDYSKTIDAKDLNPKSFITLFKERYNKTQINIVTMDGDFPENWVKPNDVQYLMSIIRSKEKCCGYKHTYSSFLSFEDAEIGGFAIIFLNSYISNTKINLGLNCNPKTDEESIRKIEKWYQTTANKN